MVRSTVLLCGQVSVGKVLYWGSKLKAVTTPSLANLGAPRPDVVVKDMAMLHCWPGGELNREKGGMVSHQEESAVSAVQEKDIYFFLCCPNCFAVALCHSWMTYIRRLPPPLSSCRAHAGCVARTAGLSGRPQKRSAAAVHAHVLVCLCWESSQPLLVLAGAAPGWGLHCWDSLSLAGKTFLFLEWCVLLVPETLHGRWCEREGCGLTCSQQGPERVCVGGCGV